VVSTGGSGSVTATTRLQPCGVRQFNLSKDPKFFDKLRDLVGLYVDPPAHAIVSSVDEKMKRAGFKLSVALHLGFPLSKDVGTKC
jgi:hypothetical protein